MLRPLDAPSLKNVSTHFAFGRNWASYADLIDERRIEEAEDGLVRLLGRETLLGKTFLDLGCGSGLHAVAAARLGASHIVAVDIDPAAVATTRRVLPRHAPNASFEVHQLSVFDLTPETYGRLAVVYSWGVLHHTGAMREAIEIAARVVEPGVSSRLRSTTAPACAASGHGKSAGTAAPRPAFRGLRESSMSRSCACASA